MKPSIYIFVATFLFYFAVTEATRCPVCGYSKGIPDDLIDPSWKPFIDESCKKDGTPNTKFMQTCAPYEPPFDKNEMGCASGSLIATIPDLGTTEQSEITVRGCFPLVDGFIDVCQIYLKEDLLALPGLPADVVEAIKAMSDDLEFELCINKGTEGEGSGGGDDSAGSLIKMNIVLLFLPILGFLAKFV